MLLVLFELFSFEVGFKLLLSPETPKSKRSLFLLFVFNLPALGLLILIPEVLLGCFFTSFLMLFLSFFSSSSSSEDSSSSSSSFLFFPPLSLFFLIFFILFSFSSSSESLLSSFLFDLDE